MPGVDPTIAVLRLYVDPYYKLIEQKKMTFSVEKEEAIQEEVDKFLGADAIRELLFSTWLASMVLVPKPNGTCAQISPSSTRPVRKIATIFPASLDCWTPTHDIRWWTSWIPSKDITRYS
ncbi:hypothetical protein LIER_05788 [Lithospermum erythrorhizon]|uniref:Uncharacterized protein n=1 Tax=Lithospermum erythrorhizon TaxID=34254 RepID=A0AAV3P2Q8_LITER